MCRLRSLFSHRLKSSLGPFSGPAGFQGLSAPGLQSSGGSDDERVSAEEGVLLRRQSESEQRDRQAPVRQGDDGHSGVNVVKLNLEQNAFQRFFHVNLMKEF